MPDLGVGAAIDPVPPAWLPPPPSLLADISAPRLVGPGPTSE